MTLPRIYFDAMAIGPLHIRWYGLAFVVTYAALYHGLRRSRVLTSRQSEDFLLVASLGMIIGSRLFFVLASYLDGTGRDYLVHPGTILMLWQGGLSFHGGLLGGTLAALWWCRRSHVSFVRVADQTALVLPLGGMLVRLANFAAGDLPGKVTTSRLFVQYPTDPLPRFPSTLFEAAGYALLGLILWLVSKKTLRPGSRSFIFLLGALALRFGIDFFRQPALLLIGLTPAQWISLVALLIFLLLWTATRLRQKRAK